jgi:thiopeptide-type bacteriocin biosynthesis protein
MSEKWGYRPLPWLLVRTPLLPAAPARPAAEALREPVADLALWIGSEALWNAWHGAAGATRRRALLKARRYADRMAHRATPYGLFAGVAMGTWGRQTDLSLIRMPGSVRTRIDMAWLHTLIEQLEGDLSIQRQLTFAVHPAVYVAGDRIYLTDPPGGAAEAAEAATGCLSLRATRPVRAVLDACRPRASHAELAAAICEATPSATRERAEQLIDELRRYGVLRSDLWPPLTVPDPGRHVVDRLTSVNDPAGRNRRVRALADDLERCDGLPPAESLAARAAAATRARELVPGVEPAFQTDATAQLGGTRLHREVGRQAARAAELLLSTTPQPEPPYRLPEYRLAVEERYGRHRRVPLLELVNPHVGIGFPEQAAPTPAPTGRDEALLGLAAQAARSGEPVVQLDAPTLALIGRPVTAQHLPQSLDLLVEVAAATPAAIDAGAFTVVATPVASASPAGRTLGRFAYLLGDGAIRAVARPPGPGDTIDADLIYQPRRPRAANVAICPARHPYAVPVGVPAPDQPTIALADLTVGFEEEQLVVRWAVTGQRVRVHYPHMVSSTLAPRVVSLLHQLAGDPVVWPFSWGVAERLPFLPRLEHGRVVLSLARWRLGGQQLRPADRQGFPAAFQSFRDRWQLPDVVLLAEHDNRITVHLGCPADLEDIRQRLQRTGTVILQERYPDPTQAWLPGPAGRHVAEFVIPVALATVPTHGPHPAARTVRRSDSPRRLAPPGSEWVYTKLYAPTVHHDHLLAGPVHRLTTELTAAGVVVDWHFLRYADPQHHLRLRFRLTKRLQWTAVTAAVADTVEALIAAGIAHRLVIDTYDREVERFGGPRGLDLAESIFAADSRAALELIRGLAHRSITVDRVQLAVMSVDALLGDLGLTAAERERLVAAMAGDRARSGRLFRTSKQALRRLLAAPAEHGLIHRILAERRSAIAACTARPPMPAGWSASNSTALASLAHLACNRIVGVDRAAEQMVYGLLARTLHSIARWPVQPTCAERAWSRISDS